MIIGVVHKDRELTISRLWSFNCIPDRKNCNDREMNDFFLCIQKLRNRSLLYYNFWDAWKCQACYKKRLHHF